jgi:hypothetical protein
MDHDGLMNRILIAATDSRANLICCFVSRTPFVVIVSVLCEREEAILGSPCEATRRTACESPLQGQTFVLGVM